MATFLEFEDATSKCRKCGAKTRVFGIERHPSLDGMALRTFECLHCENLQTDVVPLADKELAPLERRPSSRPAR